jgi:xylose isomerase
MAGKVGFVELEKYILEQGMPTMKSGRLEMLENILNDYIR